ncbi:MAG: hypothetical protein ACFE7E_08680 [Candidatus Hodarchaeota archaeon]
MERNKIISFKSTKSYNFTRVFLLLGGFLMFIGNYTSVTWLLEMGFISPLLVPLQYFDLAGGIFCLLMAFLWSERFMKTEKRARILNAFVVALAGHNALFGLSQALSYSGILAPLFGVMIFTGGIFAAGASFVGYFLVWRRSTRRNTERKIEDPKRSFFNSE